MNFADLHRLYHQPFFDLLKQARAVHEEHWPESEVQLCTLLSIKTGGCSRGLRLLRPERALHHRRAGGEAHGEGRRHGEAPRAAKENGSTRFCMGAAWKGVRGGTAKFDQVLDIVREVSTLGMEVCVTLGELGADGGARAQGGRRHRLQSQHRHLARALREHRHHAHLRGPPPHHPPRAGGRHVRLLRRHPRPRRDRSTTA